MEFRDYDPAIARWTGIDPVTHHNMSPYMAFDGNPIFWAAPSGADSTDGNSLDVFGRDRFDSNGTYIPFGDRGVGSFDEYLSQEGGGGTNEISNSGTRLEKLFFFEYVKSKYCKTCSTLQLQNMTGIIFEKLFENYIDNNELLGNIRIIKNKIKVSGETDYTVPDYFGVKYSSKDKIKIEVTALYKIEIFFELKATKNNIGMGSFSGQLKIQIQAAEKLGVKELIIITTSGINLTNNLRNYGKERGFLISHYWTNYTITDGTMNLNFVLK